MKDKRYEKLADNLVNYSVKLQKGEKILINFTGKDNDLAKELIRKAYEAGGLPFVKHVDSQTSYLLLKDVTEEQLEIMNESELAFMEKMDCYISIRASENIFESSIVPSEKMTIYSKIMKPAFNERVNNTRWCVLRYPNPSMAQLAGKPTEEFESFFFDVCNLDYSKMSAAMDNLVDLMDRTDKVRLAGPGTDLTFSIKDIPSVKCDGEYNIPDGEVFTAPVKNSVNGTISFNTPAMSEGEALENIKFTFKDGKIIEATSSNTGKMNKKLDTDEGARFIGEFAIGVNPYIIYPMKDTLFDEKIAGSIHLTPGQCYDEAPNGNDSAIHWDIVLIQTPEYGGGEIYFDDVLIRKDGLFVIDELKCLNPENLK
ncbi:MAG: aminopeptidase [Clostridia bacterium]|nr:aminopeptidase [Clostridia bacterium]